MLYLNPPYRVVEGVYLFGDFSDPRQYYYLPNNPHLASLPDGRPAIQLLIYRRDLDSPAPGQEDAVGFLSLDVDLSFDPDVLEDVQRRLRRIVQTESGDPTLEPRLAPVPFNKGTARLMVLDKVSAGPDEEGERPAEDTPTEFVTKVLQAGHPSLYGDNRAIFQARLTQDGAAALRGSLDGLTPIGVVYELEFAGLQPAFNIKVRADWEQVFSHFEEKHGADILFVEIDIQKTIDELFTNQVITFESTIEGVGEEGMQAEHDAIRQRISAFLFDTFFSPTLSKPGSDVLGSVLDGLMDAAQFPLNFGCGYSYSRKEVDVTELRTLSIDWTVRKAVKRVIYPQAHVFTLLEPLGLTVDDLVRVVDESDVFDNLEIGVAADVDWAGGDVAAISVELEYGPEGAPVDRWSIQLDKDKPRESKRAWLSDGDQQVRYSYEVVFADDTPGPSQKVDTGGWRVLDGLSLMITPRDLYAETRLEAGAIPGFPFDRWPSAHVMFRYDEPGTPPGPGGVLPDDALAPGFSFSDDGVLTTAKPVLNTRFRCNRDRPDALREVRIKYYGAEGDFRDTGWMPMAENNVVVTDPNPEVLRVNVIVAGDRRSIANVLVDLHYQDTANAVDASTTLTFDEESINKPQKWEVHLADPTKRRYRTRTTLVTTEGEFLTHDWIETDAPTLPVGVVYMKTMEVEVSLGGPLGPGVNGLRIALSYDDDTGDVHSSRTIDLRQPGDADTWKVMLQDPALRSYRYTVTWLTDTGFDVTVGPSTTSNRYLVLSGSPS